MSKIFISHSRIANSLAERIIHRLEKHGHEIVTPMSSLHPGTRIDKNLTEQLLKSDIAIFLITEDSAKISSINYDIGMTVGHAVKTGTPRILPVVLGTPEIPLNLERFLAIQNPEDPEAEIENAVSKLEGAIAAQQAKAREIKEKIDSEAGTYIKDQLQKLGKRELFNKISGMTFYFLAFLLLGLGVWFAYGRFTGIPEGKIGWNSIIQNAVLVAVVSTFLGAMVKWAGHLGKSYTVESVRIADRIHAIQFGEFYLKISGEKIEWAEIKEAFSQWNIDSGSEFHSQKVSELDPNVLSKLSALIESLHNIRKG